MILDIFKRRDVFGKQIANTFFLNFLIFKIFVGKLTKNGKKLRSLNFVYSLFLKLREHFLIKLSDNEYGEYYFKKYDLKAIDGTYLFFLAIKKILPIFKVIIKKVSGATYHLPYPLTNPKIAITVALKEIIKNSYKRKESNLVLKLYNEILDSIKKKSATYFNKKNQYRVGFNGIPFLRFVIKRKKRSKYSFYTSKRWGIKRQRRTDFLSDEEFYYTTLKDYRNKKIQKKITEKKIKYKLRRFKYYYLKKVLVKKYRFNLINLIRLKKKYLILQKKNFNYFY